MHPAIEYEITKARIADLQRQAEQNATARAAPRARQGQTPPRLHRAAGDDPPGPGRSGDPRAARTGAAAAAARLPAAGAVQRLLMTESPASRRHRPAHPCNEGTQP